MPRIPGKTIVYSKVSRVWLHLRYAEAKKHLYHILFIQSMHLTRLLIGISSLTWAFCLYADTKIFVTGRQAYDVMHAIMEENSWAILFALSGVVCLFSVIFNIRNKYTLVFDALLNCLLWTASTLAILAAFWPHETIGLWSQLMEYPPPVAIAGEFWLTIASWWNFVRQTTDRRVCCRCICEAPCPYVSTGIKGRDNAIPSRSSDSHSE